MSPPDEGSVDASETSDLDEPAAMQTPSSVAVSDSPAPNAPHRDLEVNEDLSPPQVSVVAALSERFEEESAVEPTSPVTPVASPVAPVASPVAERPASPVPPPSSPSEPVEPTWLQVAGETLAEPLPPSSNPSGGPETSVLEDRVKMLETAIMRMEDLLRGISESLPTQVRRPREVPLVPAAPTTNPSFQPVNAMALERSKARKLGFL